MGIPFREGQDPVLNLWCVGMIPHFKQITRLYYDLVMCQYAAALDTVV